MAYEIPILDVSERASTTILQYRVVKISGAGVVHTTGSSGRRALGIAQSSASTAKPNVPVRVYGISKAFASSNAIARGAWLRPTSGAVSTATVLGGTVRSATNNTQNVLGQALTSAAAGTGKRIITMLLTQSGRCSTAG